jgi:hypothetical protein
VGPGGPGGHGAETLWLSRGSQLLNELLGPFSTESAQVLNCSATVVEELVYVVILEAHKIIRYSIRAFHTGTKSVRFSATPLKQYFR